MDVISTVQSCGRSTQGLATARRLRAAGLSAGAVARAVAAGSIVRVHRRVYALAPLPGLTRYVVTDEGVAPAYAARVRAALLSVGGGAVAHRRTAAALHGWALLVEPTRTVEIAVPHGSRRAAVEHVKQTERRNLRCRVVVPLEGVLGLAVTTPVQTVVDCAVDLPLVEAVVICDSALRSGTVDLDELRRAARSLSGRRDANRVRRVLALCDPESGSVLESVLRVRMLLDGIAGFATQYVVRDEHGRHVARVDFCFQAQRLIVEVDGHKWHQDAARDQSRDNELAARGWRVLRYCWAEVVHGPDPVLAQIRAAVASRTGDGHLVSEGLLAAA